MDKTQEGMDLVNDELKLLADQQSVEAVRALTRWEQQLIEEQRKRRSKLVDIGIIKPKRPKSWSLNSAAALAALSAMNRLR